MNQKINQQPVQLFQEKLFELQEKILAFAKLFPVQLFFIRENPTTPSERARCFNSFRDILFGKTLKVFAYKMKFSIQEEGGEKQIFLTFREASEKNRNPNLQHLESS